MLKAITLRGLRGPRGLQNLSGALSLLAFMAFGQASAAETLVAGGVGEGQIAQAYLALGSIEADRVELSRLADYQADLIALAKEDPEAAEAARRRLKGCATRALVRELCAVLTQSFEATDVGGAP